jgi:hypothetical protein
MDDMKMNTSVAILRRLNQPPTFWELLFLGLFLGDMGGAWDLTWWEIMLPLLVAPVTGLILFALVLARMAEKRRSRK